MASLEDGQGQIQCESLRIHSSDCVKGELEVTK